MALGPVLGGFCIASPGGSATGLRWAFVFALAFAVLGDPAASRNCSLRPARGKTGRGASGPGRRLRPRALWRRMSPALKNLLISDILSPVAAGADHPAFVVVWCMKIISQPVSAVQFGLLTSIEMRPPCSSYHTGRLVCRTAASKKPFVLITFVLFTVSLALMFCCQDIEWLISGFILARAQEFGEPTRRR